jgi:hypothetical protein
MPKPSIMGQTLSGDERAQFLQWYEERKDKIFRNTEEPLAYCMDDVNVLRQVCCSFRNFFFEIGQYGPFLAGYHNIFRTK